MITAEEVVKYIESESSLISFRIREFEQQSIIDCYQVTVCKQCPIRIFCNAQTNNNLTLSEAILQYLEFNKLHPELFL